MHLKLICKKVPQNKNLMVTTDTVKFRQIFTNLIENAIKYTNSGEISFGYSAHEGNQLVCFVSDTGIGIDPKYHTTIFEMFRQGEQETVINYGGTGLGLAICKGNSHLLEGDIWVDSEPGNGSTFYFTINYRQKNSEIMKEEKQIYHYEGLKNKTILLVEDDPFTVDYLANIINSNGFRLFKAGSGKELHECFYRIEEVDLVLMDIRLPDTNGLDLVKHIKSIRPDLPIIAQTAFAYEEDRRKCIEAGCDDYISKPFKIDQMIDLIKVHISSGERVKKTI